jgi:probable addiction module antidote protein
MTTFHKLELADYLVTDEDVIGFLEDMAENGTPNEFMHGLRTAMHSQGMEILAQKIGEEKATLCQALANQENPSFAMMYRAVEALGLHLSMQQVA